MVANAMQIWALSHKMLKMISTAKEIFKAEKH